MIFNSTLLYALTISSYYDHSPLLMVGPCGKGSNFLMKEFKLSNFFNNALKVNYLLQSINIDNSKFSNFLDTAIAIRSAPVCDELPTRQFANMQIVLQRCVNATNSTFVNNLVAYRNGGSINCVLTTEIDYFNIDRCNFTNCKASTKGGAIYFICPKNSTQYNAITYCNFVNCFVDSTIQIQDPLLVEDSVVEGCCGGSVYCDASTVNFRNSVFNSSKIVDSGRGGAIYAKVKSIDNYTFFTSFNDCTVDGIDSYGGAIYIDLDEEGPYNMSYMTFNNCRASNGQCVYAENITGLVINYTTSINNNNMLMVDNLSFEFKVGTIILYENYQVQLIKANNYSSYPGSDRIAFTLYAQSSFDPDKGDTFFDNIIKYCFVYIHNTDDFPGIPVNPPYDARDPLEGIVIPERTPLPAVTATPVVLPPPPEMTPAQTVFIPPMSTPVQTPTSMFSPSQQFSNSEVFAAAAAAGGGGGSGLSLVAIIFIVIACLIVVIGIIIFVIFYLRSHGRCQCGKDDSLAGMKSSTYF